MPILGTQLLSFSLINIPKDSVISIPMERDLARDIYADLEFIYVIEVNPDKSFFSSSWRRTYPEIDFRFDTAMTDYNVRAVLKAIVLKNTKTNEIVDYKNIAVPASQALSQNSIPGSEINVLFSGIKFKELINKGVIIEEINQEKLHSTPTYKSPFKEGDLIIRVNDNDISNMKDFISSAQGKNLKMRIERKKRRRNQILIFGINQ